jgi:diguanylate cyclase (GGDEF)-like protein
MAHENREDHLSLYGAFRRWLAGVISPELQTEAELDPLTGLNNVRTDERVVEQALVHHRTDAGSRGRLLVRFRADVDNFKALNDHYGHRVGDRALDLIGNVLRGSVRSGEEVVSPARVGGDEFAMTLVLPFLTHPEWIRNRLEYNVAAALRREGLDRVGTVEVGVSIGFAVARPRVSLAELDAEADRSAQRRKALHNRSRSRRFRDRDGIRGRRGIGQYPGREAPKGRSGSGPALSSDIRS